MRRLGCPGLGRSSRCLSLLVGLKCPRLGSHHLSHFPDAALTDRCTGQAYMTFPPDLEIRDRSSRVESEAPLANVTDPDHPPPTYRSWNLWGYPDAVPGVYAYDAESDADNAICEYLSKHSEIDETTRVSKRLRGKWWSWNVIEGQGGLEKVIASKSKL